MTEMTTWRCGTCGEGKQVKASCGVCGDPRRDVLGYDFPSPPIASNQSGNTFHIHAPTQFNNSSDPSYPDMMAPQYVASAEPALCNHKSSPLKKIFLAIMLIMAYILIFLLTIFGFTVFYAYPRKVELMEISDVILVVNLAIDSLVTWFVVKDS